MPNKPQNCVCEHCGIAFVSKNQKKIPQRFCSIACSAWGRKKAVTVPKRRRGSMKSCPICQSAFYVKASLSTQAKREGIYCSRRCKGLGARHRPRPCETCQKIFQPTYKTSKRFCSQLCSGVARRNGKMVPCTLCGDMFYLPKGRLELAQQYFCSLAHANIWQGRLKVEHTCTVCGKQFKWSASRGKQTTVQYCSLACRDKHPKTAAQLLAMNVRQQQRHTNGLERLGYAWLDSLHIVYEPQKVIGNKFCVDAFLPQQKIVIQFDGDYWHGNPARFPILDARQQRRVRLDASQDAYMRACGYIVIRLWETDMHRHLPSLTAQLQQQLTLSTHTPVVLV
jgi:very-short-patch-repair endonuclease